MCGNKHLVRSQVKRLGRDGSVVARRCSGGTILVDDVGLHEPGLLSLLKPEQSPHSSYLLPLMSGAARRSGRKAAGRERIVTRGRGVCRPSVLLPPPVSQSYHIKVTNVS